jgi:hypothetical protein
MKINVGIRAFMLLSSLLAVAQLDGQSANPKGPLSSPQLSVPAVMVLEIAQTSIQAKHDRLLEGCLRNSHGILTLTDIDGKVYQLQGETAQLAQHVGQEATITGIEENSSVTAGSLMFTVKKVDLIGRVCQGSK